MGKATLRRYVEAKEALPPQITNKRAVIAMRDAHPDWTAARMAQELGCASGYVRATLARNRAGSSALSEDDRKMLNAIIKRLEWEWETNENYILRFDDAELELVMRLLRAAQQQ